MFKCWNTEMLKMLKCWNVEMLNMLKYWNIEMLKMLKCWKVEVLKWWNVDDMLKCWQVERLKCWNIEILKCWNVEILKWWFRCFTVMARSRFKISKRETSQHSRFPIFKISRFQPWALRHPNLALHPSDPVRFSRFQSWAVPKTPPDLLKCTMWRAGWLNQTLKVIREI